MPPQSWIFELEISKILTEKKFPNRSQLNYFSIVSVQFLVNSQAPVSPELASRGVFRLSRLSLNSYVKTIK